MKLFILAILQLAVCCSYALEVLVADGQYIRKTGDTVTFHIQLDKGRENQLFNYKIRGNHKIRQSGQLKSDASGRASVTVSADQCGFIYVEAADNGKRSGMSVAVDPQNILPGRKKPETFDLFWQKTVKELDAMPLRYEMTPVDSGKRGKGFKCYEIKIMLGGEHKDAYAMLTIPEDAKPRSLVARLQLCGAGTDKAIPEFNAGAVTLVLNPMSIKHNGPMGATVKSGGKLAGYMSWGIDNAEKNYFIGMFKRVYASLRLLKSLPEWDQQILIVRGHSQGGGQALAAAGLDPDVTLCIAHQPALCNHGGWENGTESGWPTYHLNKTVYQADPEKALKVLDLIDGCFFAANIRTAEVHVFAGFKDRICAASSVYAAYNMIPSADKSIVNQFDKGHTMPRPTILETEKIIEAHIRKMRKNPR